MRHVIKSVLSPKHQRRPLPSLLIDSYSTCPGETIRWAASLAMSVYLPCLLSTILLCSYIPIADSKSIRALSSDSFSFHRAHYSALQCDVHSYTGTMYVQYSSEDPKKENFEWPKLLLKKSFLGMKRDCRWKIIFKASTTLFTWGNCRYSLEYFFVNNILIYNIMFYPGPFND